MHLLIWRSNEYSCPWDNDSNTKSQFEIPCFGYIKTKSLLLKLPLSWKLNEFNFDKQGTPIKLTEL